MPGGTSPSFAVNYCGSPSFAARLLPIDAGVAHQWGQLLAEAGRSLPAIDSLLAATALHHNLVLVTRNLKDFAGLPVQVLNPWEAE
jgi:predicted nucleic acid-binding protein